ncbi:MULTISPECIES: chromate transporter [Aneurinibacillus]|jgi:chromate transporter|uniref:Putative transporter YwrA n=1 Tax=Aneurinibacillus danicus TaxID=267746 RepID=A0A511V5N9_9BACL|nr:MULTISPECIES: chromate transporter [Aneurinibacillus]GEN33421.1 putative transporter YwrA [Aneurinibacillus danicus]
MVLWHLFWAFCVANILGYGGGPPSIPLIQNEVVNHYGWMTNQEFGEAFAFGNALPSPIATKLGGYIGYQVAGVPGAIAALLGTIAPSAIAMIVLLRFLTLFKTAPQVKAMTQGIRPIVAVLMGLLAYEFFRDAVIGPAGILHTILLAGLSYLFMERIKVHPALVISSSLLYGAVFLS